MTNAKIVVAQTMDYVRGNIASARNPESTNQLYLTGDPGEVIQKVSDEDIAAIVTGQRFYNGGLMKTSDVINGPTDGNELAQRVRELSPNTLTFRYSLTPGSTHALDGDIPRGRDYDESVIVDLVDAEELGDLVRSQDFEGLRKRFPEIRWYQRE